MVAAPRDPLGWIRQNLFRTPLDSVLTLLFGGLLLLITVPVITWLLGENWEIVRVNMRNLLVGPEIRGDDVWAPAVGFYVIALAVGLFAGAARRRELVEIQGEDGTPPRPSLAGVWRSARDLGSRSWPLIALVVFMLVLTGSLLGLTMTIIGALLLLIGRIAGVRIPGKRALLFTSLFAILSPAIAVAIIRWGFGIDWSDWGGFLLVVFAGGTGIALSFPLGLLLALGRRSKLPAIRALSVGYIEFFRGVPLVVLLLIGSLVLGLVLPRSVIPSELIRAIIIFILFTAAYIAEIVRGGLQSLPAGQEEASKALGMPAWRTMSFIVLPQALRNVIPALVGQSISLWKDTSLLFIIGFSEPLRLASAFTRQEEFRGQGLVVLTLFFAALIYWVVSFTMSRESQRLERKLGVGTR